MTFAEIFSLNQEAGFVLMQEGLFCGGCPMAQLETLEDGCIAHGVDVEKILKKLNKNKNE